MRGRIINREWWWSILQSVATFGRWCCSLVNSVVEWWSPSSPPITTDCTDCSSVWSSRQQQQKCLLTDPALLMDRRFRIEWEKIAATTIIFFSFFSSFQPLSALLHYFVWLTDCLSDCLSAIITVTLFWCRISRYDSPLISASESFLSSNPLTYWPTQAEQRSAFVHKTFLNFLKCRSELYQAVKT